MRAPGGGVKEALPRAERAACAAPRHGRGDRNAPAFAGTRAARPLVPVPGTCAPRRVCNPARAPSLRSEVSRPLVRRWLVPFLLLNVALVALAYAWLLVPVLRGGGYMPAWTDEYGYVLDARSFAQNGTLSAARVKEENVSRWFAASTHGPAYILLQGGIARLFGDPVTLSVWPNVVVLALTLLLILLYPVPLADRLWIVLLLLLHFVVFLYAFTWMVETYQVLFGVGASLLLVSLYRVERGDRRFARRLVAFVALVLLLALFRVSYALWALGVVPLARDRRELVRYGALALAVIATGVVVMQALTAPNPYWPLSRAMAGLAHGRAAAALALLAGNVGENLRRYFVTETEGQLFYVAMKYVTVAVLALLAGAAVKYRDRLALAASLVLGAHFVLLFVLYDALSWREHRHLAPAFDLAVIVLVVGGYRRTYAVLYVVLLALFPQVRGYVTGRIIPERRLAAAEWAANEPARRALAELADLVASPGGGTVTVLHAKDYYRNLSLFPLAIPVRSTAGQPIRYTANLGTTPDTRRFGRIPIDYVLLPPGSPPEPGWKRLHADRFFVLYDLRSASGAGAGATPTPRRSAGDSLTRFTSSPSSASSSVRSSS